MQSDDEMLNGQAQQPLKADECRMYGVRWFILAIFVAYSATNSVQWIQFSIIADVIRDYYSVSYSVVDWTSLVYMVLYIPFIFPASYLLDKLAPFRLCFLV
ncbi:uncharacterized MFS-type transporter C09D4.1-like [Agrilus planipennis]|uniref:Uncharacterized MFS-type transporter C09D4.1-like n=1 Tax=Agrilus planipennis TaxID=224129 RepID=A0A7F5RF03_AGRPL|nr:uncharacterized MFS-type transporter C09D4.1-like [Agrilus planipennis]